MEILWASNGAVLAPDIAAQLPRHASHHHHDDFAPLGRKGLRDSAPSASLVLRRRIRKPRVVQRKDDA